MSTTVEPSVERLFGVLGGVARERGDPCSVRVCGGRQVEQQRNGHTQEDRQMQPMASSAERGDKEGELRAERGDGKTVRQTSTHTLSCHWCAR